jgi:spore coat polysaccharide biosynthesis protein SpsF
MILAILQARSSSTRFPNKVLADLGGQPMILQQIKRLKRSKLIDKLVVATTTDPSDDQLVELLHGQGISFYRGSLDNVMKRFIDVIQNEKPDIVVRLTADCPLADARVIDLVIQEHISSGSEYTSNTLKPTYPDGLDVECFVPITLQNIYDSNPSEIECEHVTYGLYNRPDFCSTHSVEQEVDRSNLRWTVDLPEDLDFVRAVYSAFEPDCYSFGQEDLVEMAQTRPEFHRTNTILERNASLIEQESGL